MSNKILITVSALFFILILSCNDSDCIKEYKNLMNKNSELIKENDRLKATIDSLNYVNQEVIEEVYQQEDEVDMIRYLALYYETKVIDMGIPEISGDTITYSFRLEKDERTPYIELEREGVFYEWEIEKDNDILLYYGDGYTGNFPFKEAYIEKDVYISIPATVIEIQGTSRRNGKVNIILRLYPQAKSY